jgi:hypothetical protein
VARPKTTAATNSNLPLHSHASLLINRDFLSSEERFQEDAFGLYYCFVTRVPLGDDSAENGTKAGKCEMNDTDVLKYACAGQ